LATSPTRPAPTEIQRLRLANVALAAGSLALCLLVAEVGVRWLVDLRKQMPIPVYDVDLSTRLAFLPGRERTYQTDEFRYTLRSNRFGRRDVEWSQPVLEDERGVLFVGDSFVLGAGVEDEESIPTRLEAWTETLGERREVFNFGMAAVGLPHYMLLLEEALQIGVRADTVLLGIFVGNDFEYSALQPLVPEDSLLPVDAVPPRFAPRSALLDYLRLRVSHSSRFVGWTLTVGDWLGVRLYNTVGSYIFLRSPSPEQVDVFDRILATLGGFQELCRRNQRELYVVIFPNKMQVENHDELENSLYDPELPNRRIVEYCESRGLRCLDQLPVLANAYARERRPLYFPVDRHLNTLGNQTAAQSIFAWLERAQALEPRSASAANR
jgi:hypothetical protein